MFGKLSHTALHSTKSISPTILGDVCTEEESLLLIICKLDENPDEIFKYEYF